MPSLRNGKLQTVFKYVSCCFTFASEKICCWHLSIVFVAVRQCSRLFIAVLWPLPFIYKPYSVLHARGAYNTDSSCTLFCCNHFYGAGFWFRDSGRRSCVDTAYFSVVLQSFCMRTSREELGIYHRLHLKLLMCPIPRTVTSEVDTASLNNL
jgi:hypothetical protein